jgi:hypothetical protein
MFKFQVTEARLPPPHHTRLFIVCNSPSHVGKKMATHDLELRKLLIHVYMTTVRRGVGGSGASALFYPSDRDSMKYVL